MVLQIGDLTALLSELTCIKCHKLLSVLPIYTSLDGSICGRCKDLIEGPPDSNIILLRNTVYEAVAKHIVFPCFNQAFGCMVNLKHDEVENHEKVCKYRVRACPFNVVDTTDCALQCDWQNVVTCLPDHLRDCHLAMMLSNPHTLSLSTDQTNIRVNFMQINVETAFIVLSRYDKTTNKFCCIVMSEVDHPVYKNYVYELEFGKKDECFLKVRKNEIENLLDTAEALKNFDKMITVDLPTIANLFGNVDSNLQCTISIIKKDDCKPNVAPVQNPGTSSLVEQEIDLDVSKAKPALDSSKTKPCKENALQIDLGKQKALELNTLILEEFECPVCSNYMRPPIFICSQGHSLCKECKSKILTCSICRIPMGDARNFALEKLTEKLSYPCKYSHYGCTEVLPVPDIDKHQVQCSRICPLTIVPRACSFEGCVINQVDHIYEHHANILLKENNLCEIPIDPKSSDKTVYRVTICNNEIFILCMMLNTTLKINFLHVGMERNKPQYRYKLTFVDQIGWAMTFIINQFCQVVPLNINNVFEKCLEIPLKMLLPYVLKRNPTFLLAFKFEIEEI